MKNKKPLTSAVHQPTPDHELGTSKILLDHVRDLSEGRQKRMQPLNRWAYHRRASKCSHHTKGTVAIGVEVDALLRRTVSPLIW